MKVVVLLLLMITAINCKKKIIIMLAVNSPIQLVVASVKRWKFAILAKKISVFFYIIKDYLCITNIKETVLKITLRNIVMVVKYKYSSIKLKLNMI